MSESDRLEVLQKNRATLLACEAIGWIHMAGKAHPDFLRQAAGESPSWPMKRALLSPGLQLQRCELWTLLSNGALKDRLPCSVDVLLSGFMGVKGGDKKGEEQCNLLGLLQAGHGASSGIEKNASSNYQKQESDNTHLTSAFGEPVRNLLQQRPSVLEDTAWPMVEERIKALLDGLFTRSRDPGNVQEWLRWRDAAIGPNGWLRRDFLTTLAETRIPNNDVTLWDQSYVAAALFKAAAAGAVLAGSAFEWGNGVKNSTQWRVLTIGLGAEHYEGRAVGIGDWTGTRQAIQRFFDDVRELVEVELAIGACVYRDERVLAFTFPGQRFDNCGGLDDSTAAGLREGITSRVDNLARNRQFETPPCVKLSSATRSFVVLASEAEAARRELEIAVHRSWTVPDHNNRGEHVCPVSLVRMQAADATRKKHVSQVCLNRRNRRCESWMERGGDTIWITEVADENDRVALLTFNLGLQHWLDGFHVDSLRAQSVARWRRETEKIDKATNPIDLNECRESLISHISDFLKSPKLGDEGNFDDPVLKSLIYEFHEKNDLRVLFEEYVQDRLPRSSPAWDDVQHQPVVAAAWLTHQLFRKNASPGRVHRFWRSTQEFARDALEQFRTLVNEQDPLRNRRVRVTVSGDVRGLKDREVYSGHLPLAPNDPFEILYLKEQNDFITICNLERIIGKKDDREKTLAEDFSEARELVGQEFEAKDDDLRRYRFKIDSVDTARKPLHEYSPLIVLEENPERFRVLVPLSSAEACVDHVVGKWKNEMARVWDRLPLRVGLVAFPRKTPFQAVIEATRNIEDDLAVRDSEPWSVHCVESRGGGTAIGFIRSDGQHELVTVPTRLPDGRDHDVYYPNVAIRNGGARDAHDFEAPHKDAPSTVYRWVPELRPGDGVSVAPSRFASVFLDTTARRFEPTDRRYLSDWQRERESWGSVEAHAGSNSAAHAVEAALRDARQRWTDPDGDCKHEAWLLFVRATLANEWGVTGSALDKLVDAARTGCLERALSWNLHVLKRKLGNKQ